MDRMVTITTRPCMVCNATSQVEVDEDKLRRWHEGELIQSVWPEKTLDERELLMTGTHEACWEKMFDEEDNDADDSEGEDTDVEG